MPYTIYMATNSLNGKRYVGVTRRGMPYRRKRHLYLAAQDGRQCPRFYDAIRKHGPLAFQWTILAIVDTQAEAYLIEGERVATLVSEYNSCRGGRVGPDEAWNKKRVICLEDGLIFESAAEASRFYDCDFSEVCKSCRRAQPCRGKHFRWYVSDISATERRLLIKKLIDEEVRRRKKVKRRKTSYAGAFVRDGKSVICLDDGAVFRSVAAAARHYDIGTGALNELCHAKRGRTNLAGKHFAFAAEVGQRWVA